MAIGVHAPETDLLLPRPEPGEQWDPHTIHTYYFGFSIPEAELGAFLYLRLQPAFPLCQGGVCVFGGTDNVEATDIAFLDYEITMPWPTVDGRAITTDNGLRIEFTEPGRTARITYTSHDGAASIDVTAAAVTPLLARGHVMPGEENHHDIARAAGGSEQFMHMTGELVLDGVRHAIDCHAPRDRSWNQVRVERRGAVPVPPVGWSPMYFGPDLVFNQISFEAPDTDPPWLGLYDVGDRPSHHYAWVLLGDETRTVTWVRRTVLERHPRTHLPLRQVVEARDDQGGSYRFEGQAVAAASLPAWPNVSFHDSVYRWTDERGRTTHATYQEIWFDEFQKLMKGRTPAAAAHAAG